MPDRGDVEASVPVPKVGKPVPYSNEFVGASTSTSTSTSTKKNREEKFKWGVYIDEGGEIIQEKEDGI